MATLRACAHLLLESLGVAPFLGIPRRGQWAIHLGRCGTDKAFNNGFHDLVILSDGPLGTPSVKGRLITNPCLKAEVAVLQARPVSYTPIATCHSQVN